MLAYTTWHHLFILLYRGDNGAKISIVTPSLESPGHFIRLGTGVSSKIKNNERPEAGQCRGKRKGGGKGAVGASDSGKAVADARRP